MRGTIRRWRPDRRRRKPRGSERQARRGQRGPRGEPRAGRCAGRTAAAASGAVRGRRAGSGVTAEPTIDLGGQANPARPITAGMRSGPAAAVGCVRAPCASAARTDATPNPRSPDRVEHLPDRAKIVLDAWPPPRYEPAHERRRGAVVKLVITPACHAGGRGFESRPLRQGNPAEMRGFSFPDRGQPGRLRRLRSRQVARE
jgi:hypothetical protein